VVCGRCSSDSLGLTTLEPLANQMATSASIIITYARGPTSSDSRQHYVSLVRLTCAYMYSHMRARLCCRCPRNVPVRGTMGMSIVCGRCGSDHACGREGRIDPCTTTWRATWPHSRARCHMAKRPLGQPAGTATWQAKAAQRSKQAVLHGQWAATRRAT
jgi:hypothetical protein